jgi:ABC-2 type transport system permease protein
VEDHTLVYLTLRPIARTAIVIAKYVAAAVIVIPLVEISVVTMGEIASRKAAPPQDLALLAVDTGNTAASLLLAGFGGAAAYLALFLLLGLLMPQRALLVGFVYVLLWEGIAAGLSTALSTLSVRRYVQGVLDTHLSNGALAQVASSTLSAGGSALGLLIVVGGALSLTTWRLRRMQLL